MLVRTNIYLPQKTIEKLKRKAKEQKTTMSEIVRNAVEKQEKEEYQQVNGALLLLDMANKAKKAGRGDKRDIAKNHDYYLYVEPYEQEQKQFLKEVKSSK
jgi:hypothetical protein